MDNDQEFIVTRLSSSIILVSTISNIFFLNNYQSLEKMMPKLLQVACQFYKYFPCWPLSVPINTLQLSCTQQKTVTILNLILGNEVGDFPFNLKTSQQVFQGKFGGLGALHSKENCGEGGTECRKGQMQCPVTTRHMLLNPLLFCGCRFF